VRANPDSIPYKKFFREKINLKHLEMVKIFISGGQNPLLVVPKYEDHGPK
jgi:hypothetical protein